MRRGKILIILFLVVVLAISVFVWYNQSSKTTFKEVINNDLEDLNETSTLSSKKR